MCRCKNVCLRCLGFGFGFGSDIGDKLLKRHTALLVYSSMYLTAMAKGLANTDLSTPLYGDVHADSRMKM